MCGWVGGQCPGVKDPRRAEAGSPDPWVPTRKGKEYRRVWGAGGGRMGVGNQELENRTDFPSTSILGPKRPDRRCCPPAGEGPDPRRKPCGDGPVFSPTHPSVGEVTGRGT